MLLVVVQEEHAPFQDLLQDSSLNALADVPQVQDSSCGVRAQGSLLKVPDSKPVEQVLLVLQQLEELQVCVWPGDNDGRGALAKEVIALLGGVPEELEAPNVQAARWQCP